MLHRTATILLAALVGAGVPAAADDGAGVTFHDLAADEASGIDYRRAPSATNAVFERIKAQPLYTMPLIVATPEKPRGSPGVALLDFDGDGDLDLYVTNGPGAANSLYANRLEKTGALRFEDVAEAAGVAATDQDSTGVCFGDLDNDGDPDLIVLGRSEPNRLFENLGDGTFRDATAESRLGESDLGHTACSVGDVDGDGLLDLAVANSYDWSRREATLVEPWEDNHPNQLFVNEGGLRFRDASASSGIRNLTGFRPPRDGAATITWALSLVDYDQDGDLDLLQADDQGGLLPPKEPSRGLIQVLNNDGTGRFTAVTDRVGTDLPGTSWMGLAFADFNCDGHMDFFATNMGDYVFSAVDLPFTRGQLSSRAFLGTSEGGFVDAGPGALRATPFGWSVMAPDLDNDGDPDVVFFGSLDGALHTITADNPGAVLLNPGCSAHFEADLDALAVDHTRRNVHGGATGDLNRDGFPDLVTASAFDIPEEVPLKRYPVEYDSPFDATAWYVEAFSPAGGGAFTWNGLEFPDGGLAVEINDGNDNGWVEVRTLGTVGLLRDGRVNRDGVGAVIRVTPEGGRTTLRPVAGGSGYASQDALAQLFGLGRAQTATVEVLWPGGAVNHLHDVGAGERIVFPEIPCDPRDPSLGRRKYRSCVAGALEMLRDRGLLSRSLAARFLASALRARTCGGCPAGTSGQRWSRFWERVKAALHEVM
ncbi:MAG TPA: CRTAC1 family protein [Thermoanaerobaculia bacterium]|nr:CRTAC1 family protein [Thermoanaerobaculia bacterium]